MSALRESPVPVPVVRLLVEDSDVIGAPFYVMDEVSGQVLRTAQDVADLPAADRQVVAEGLVDTLADLHDIDPGEVGLAALGRADGYLRRQVERWTRQYDAIATRDLPLVHDLARRLLDTMPAQERAGIVHGDYRLDNVIVELGGRAPIAAVLDWEMATLGDTLADLGTFLMFWDEPGRPFNPISNGQTAVPGMPTRDEVVERYARRRDVQLDDLYWYLTFSQFRLAVILEQIHARHLAGRTRGDGFEDVGGMVVDLLEAATS